MSDVGHGYIIYHAPTGAMDGIYFDPDPEHAVGILESWRSRVPGQWLLLRMEREQGGRYSEVIPDERFAANIFGLKKWSEQEIEALSADLRVTLAQHST